jgi:bZIP transcription factor
LEHSLIVFKVLIMAAVVAVSVPTQLPDASAARKRRREILAFQRQALEAPALVAPLDADHNEVEQVVKRCKAGHNEVEQVVKRSKVSAAPIPTATAAAETPPVEDMEAAAGEFATAAVSTSSAGTAAITTIATKKKLMAAKKPQMKYDPEVPMTKEDAAVWRREQRRKRNRESAAMSRQRQRDRIADLEVEVDEWTAKVGSILDRIKKLEEASGIDSRSLVPELDLVPDQSLELEIIHNTSTFVSPPSSPGRDSPILSSPEASPIASSCIKAVVSAVLDQVLGGYGDELEFSDKMISRHAAS